MGLRAGFAPAPTGGTFRLVLGGEVARRQKGSGCLNIHPPQRAGGPAPRTSARLWGHERTLDENQLFLPQSETRGIKAIAGEAGGGGGGSLVGGVSEHKHAAVSP